MWFLLYLIPKNITLNFKIEHQIRAKVIYSCNKEVVKF